MSARSFSFVLVCLAVALVAVWKLSSGVEPSGSPGGREDPRSEVAPAAPEARAPETPDRAPDPAPASSAPASLELVFQDERSRPVGGVRVRLLPGADAHGFSIPDAVGPPGAGASDVPEGRSDDATGTVFFDGLAPGVYGFRILSDHAWRREEWRRAGARDPLASGPAAISGEKVVLAAGEAKRQVVTLACGVVAGRLVVPGRLMRPAVARICNLTEDSCRVESEIRSGDGGFRVEGVYGGTKLLRAFAEVEEGHYYFYHARFPLDPCGVVDLGDVPPRDGPISDGIVVLERNGAEVDVESVYGVSALRAELQLIRVDKTPPGFAEMEFRTVDPIVGEPFYLHGLAGTWRLHATDGSFGDDFWPSPRPAFRVETSAAATVGAPFSGVRLAFPVVELAPLRIRVLYPEGSSGFHTRVVLWSPSGRHLACHVRPPREGLESIEEVRLPEGAYEAVAHPDPRYEVDTPRFLYAEGRIDVRGDASELVLTFQPAACVEATVSRRGAPLRSGPIGITFPGWVDEAGDPVWVYMPTTDDEGRALVPGLPPGREFVSAVGRATVRFRSGGAGETTRVALDF